MQFSPLVKNRERKSAHITLLSMDDPERMYTVYYFLMISLFGCRLLMFLGIYAIAFRWQHFMYEIRRNIAIKVHMYESVKSQAWRSTVVALSGSI